MKRTSLLIPLLVPVWSSTLLWSCLVFAAEPTPAYLQPEVLKAALFRDYDMNR